MCIMDTEDNIFGALISSPIVISKTFYGTGECFLFKAKPEFEVYKWSQENSNFVRWDELEVFDAYRMKSVAEAVLPLIAATSQWVRERASLVCG